RPRPSSPARGTPSPTPRATPSRRIGTSSRAPRPETLIPLFWSAYGSHSDRHALQNGGGAGSAAGGAEAEGVARRGVELVHPAPVDALDGLDDELRDAVTAMDDVVASAVGVHEQH